MLSQFTADGDKLTLAQLSDFPKDVYPVGRLDADSEGLLILTNDKELNHRLLNPKFKHSRAYLVQIEGSVTDEAIVKLCSGVSITVEGKTYQTLPAKATILTIDPILPVRNPPIRFRKNKPTSWIEFTLYEGKNRQVRKMTASIGFPTLRLVRKSIEGINIGDMQPGEVIALQKENIYHLLFDNKNLK